ncbi:DUF3021 domain-containing protein [Roseburia hominis]
MRRKGRPRNRFWKYLSLEIAIEYKACLYTFCILVFYCAYRLLNGVFEAQILHLCEMFVSAYVIGYFQVYVLGNFDESDKLGGKECACIAVCTLLYAGVSVFFKWFDRNLYVTAGFCGFLVLCYLCVLVINRLKRAIDTENLNSMLVRFKQGERERLAEERREDEDGKYSD